MSVTRILFALLFLPVAAAPAAGTDKVDFNFQIRPLLSDRCFTCHGPDQKARKAKLRLDTPEGALKELDDGWAIVKPGQPDKSELVRRIFTDNPDDEMPPPDSDRSLSQAEKELLKRWIAEGAEFKPHWSFIPVGKVTPPTPQNKSWRRNPIDSFVLARLEKENLQPSPEASREILIRRLAFGLTGLPPTPAEINNFLADTSSNAYERVVEHYLNSSAYGERMAMDWLDLARYADTYGYQEDVERDMSPWRDWVIRAFNENLPYDKFLAWQLAGDLLPNPTRDQILATAFNRLHRQTDEGGSLDEEFRAEYAVDRVNTVGTAMLGMTFGCARCHDHKYDPISQRDYYSMFAFFNNIDESGMYSHFTRATPGPAMLLGTDEQAMKAARLKSQIEQAERRLAEIEKNAAKDFQSWLKSDGNVKSPAPVARFAFDSLISVVTTNKGTNYFTADASEPSRLAKLMDEPELVAGQNPTNYALQFSGDNQLICTNVGDFKRTDEFSFSLWLKPTEKQQRAVVLHHSRAWTDSGSRGYELVLDEGRPFFGLIHFWPGNAAAVRAKEPLPLNEWSRLVITYDGSSRASGIKIFRNGEPLETEIVRDNLYKDIVHRKEWNDMEVGKIHLQLAGRFRDSGFKNGLIDDLQVFDVRLTEAEVAEISGERNGPLTLALSPRERERQSARSNSSKSFDKTQPREMPQERRAVLPLPKREGRGEGKGLFEYYLARRSEPYRAALAELKSLREQENNLVNDIPEIMVMKEMSQPRPTHLLKRGAYDAPGELVQRDTPSSIMAFPKSLPRDRLGLAQWMIDRKNPLTARVVVNRIWKLHFGRGIVATPEDFGSQGSLPSHPELLDWLAGWFMDNGWDVKTLNRLIVESATFRQSSQASKELLERDPENVLLARGPKQRLLAEEIRDSALAASGLLVTNIGGPSVKPYQPAGLWEESGTGAKYKQDHGDKLYRRSLYTFWKRTAPPPAMLSFDAITREVCTARRETTTTPLQALVLLNDPQFVEASRSLGEKLLKEFPDDLDARIRHAFQSLTGRLPDEREIAVLRQLFDQQKTLFAKDEAAAEKFLSTGESKWDQSLQRAEFAATATLVNAVMNLDEFVVTR